MMAPMGMSGALWLMPGGMVLLFLAVVAVAIGVVRYVRRPIPVAASALGSGESTGLAVVKERYARGEIDHAEFERLVDHILRADGRSGREAR